MKLLNFLGFIAFIYVGISTAFAHPMMEIECREFATDAVRVVVARGAGISKDNITLAFIKSLNTQTMIGYVKDTEDGRMVLKMIDGAFYPLHGPLSYGAMTYDRCTTHIKNTEV